MGYFFNPLVMLGIGLAIGSLRSVPGGVSAAATAAITASAAKKSDPVPCDASGNPLSATAATTVTPAATVPCGSGSDSGKTQCIDTSKAGQRLEGTGLNRIHVNIVEWTHFSPQFYMTLFRIYLCCAQLPRGALLCYGEDRSPRPPTCAAPGVYFLQGLHNPLSF
jgi:hypothetical protein